MAHDDMTDYSKNSARVLGPKFDKMLADLAIDVNTSGWKCTLNDSTAEAKMPRNQCKGKYLDCANDEISEQKIAMLFDPIKCEQNDSKLSNGANNGASVSSINQNDGNGEDDDEVITFELDFNRRKNAEIKPNNFHFNEVSTSGTHSRSNVENEYQPVNSWQNRPNFVNNKRKCDDEYGNGAWKQRNWTRNDANDECDRTKPLPMFKTGLDELEIRYDKKFGTSNAANQSTGTGRKTLGGRRTVGSQFVPPVMGQQQQKLKDNDTDVDMFDSNDRLKHIDPKMIELIRSEIMDNSAPIGMQFRFLQIEIEVKFE